MWPLILRTRTAIGQVVLDEEEHSQFITRLQVTDSEGRENMYSVEGTFLLPHDVKRDPEFRFLDLVEYYRKNKETADIPVEARRQDGIFLIWDTERIRKELTKEQAAQFDTELSYYSPTLYAFLPYNALIWRQINESLTGVKSRRHLSAGLHLAINRQRLADTFDFNPSRFETLSRNLFTLVHFDEAKPDQGRKTVQDEVMGLANAASDRALQYLAKQRISYAVMAIHETMEALQQIGAIDKTTMRNFDQTCLEPAPELSLEEMRALRQHE